MEHSEDGESKIEYFSTTEYSGGDMYAYNAPRPVTPEVDHTRPGIITFICVLGFIGSAAAAITGFTEYARNIGTWYPPLLWVSSVIYCVTYIGLWRMKGWAPILLLVLFLATQAILYGMGIWTPISLGSAIIVAIAFSYLKKMD